VKVAPRESVTAGLFGRSNNCGRTGDGPHRSPIVNNAEKKPPSTDLTATSNQPLSV
jgi:hypothetical protein